MVTSSSAFSVLTRPMTPPTRHLNPLLRYFVGDTLRTEAERLSGLYVTGGGYRRALSAYVHRQHGIVTPFLWEVRDFIDRISGETVPEVLDNVRAGLR